MIRYGQAGRPREFDPAWWRDRAACRHEDTEAFYPTLGEQNAGAKKVCARCPVKAECLQFALETKQDHGVWGGKSATERLEIRLGRKSA